MVYPQSVASSPLAQDLPGLDSLRRARDSDGFRARAQESGGGGAAVDSLQVDTFALMSTEETK